MQKKRTEIIRESLRKLWTYRSFISVKEEEGIDEIRELIHGKTTVLAGPSGVGKSSLMNLLQPEAQMETGEVSEKIKARASYNKTFRADTYRERYVCPRHPRV